MTTTGPMSPDELARCVADIIELGNRVRARNELDERAQAKPPADPAQLAAFTAEVGDLPPSLRQLLALHDGIACFDYVDVELFPIAYLREHQAALEAEWVDAGKFARGELYVFARSDWDSLAVAFLRKERDAAGEPPVVMFDARGVIERYASLADYLRARRAWFAEHAAS
jgi:hypothetical protein